MVQRNLKRVAVLVVSGLLMTALMFGQAVAGERTLSLNSGAENVPWFISGESSLVMNGFDLSSFGVALPAAIDRVSISVDRPVPNTSIDVVIYQDANGGSPSDAAVAGRTTVNINQAGVFTATFPTPVTVNQPAVWVGFYLPVNFQFFGDNSGSSVLTYWAWTPGGTFDLNNLASAQVLGPADGTAPVGINMGGKARITLEITGAAGSTSGAVSTGVPGTITTQTTGSSSANLGLLQAYSLCPDLSYDTADIAITYGYSVGPTCREIPVWNAPLSPNGYIRQIPLYDITFYRDNGLPITDRLDNQITHCIRANPEYIGSGVIGIAYGTPRVWRLLPTQRFGDRICAEIRRGGSLAYFTPIAAFSATPTPNP